MKKEVLTLDEVRTLANTHYEGEHKEVQRAFIFTLFTSIRWCDVKLLTYGNVDATTRTLRFNQKKESRIKERTQCRVVSLLTMIYSP